MNRILLSVLIGASSFEVKTWAGNLTCSEIFPAQAISPSLAKVRLQKRPLRIKDAELMADLKRVAGDFTYDVRFGSLSASEFEKLAGYFKVGGRLRYETGRDYNLVDFLPAKMQALLNHRLENSIRLAPDLDQVNLFYKNYGKVFSTVNCLGTAWEMVRDSSEKTSFYGFMPARAHIQSTLESLGRLVKSEQVQFGDMILFYKNVGPYRYVQHAAVALIYGFYFERTDSGSAPFFRLVRFEDMKTRIEKSVKDSYVEGDPKTTATFEWRRFSNGLPMPPTIFSAAHTKDPAVAEYARALPASENKETTTLYADARIGGGTEVTLEDIAEFRVRLDSNERGEFDPAAQSSSRMRSAD